VRAVLREESYSVGNAGEDQLGAVVVATILLCGQHCPILRTNIKKILWSSPRHGDLAVHIMDYLVLREGFTELSTFLTSNNCDHLTKCFSQLLPKLQSSFLSHPGEQHCLAWLLSCLPHPTLSDQLSQLLPHSLRWLDHWLPYHRILGALVAQHILHTCPHTQLSWYGRDKLLASALTPLLHSSDIEVLDAAWVPLLEVTRCRHRSTAPHQVGPADMLVSQVMNRLSLDADGPVCVVLAKLLEGLVDVLGVGVARWVSKISQLLVGKLEQLAAVCCEPTVDTDSLYPEDVNEPESPGAGSAVQHLLCTWTRVTQLVPVCSSRQTKTVLSSLVRLLMFYSCSSPGSTDLCYLRSCLVAVARCGPDVVLRLTRGLEQFQANDTFVEVVKEFTEVARKSLNK